MVNEECLHTERITINISALISDDGKTTPNFVHNIHDEYYVVSMMIRTIEVKTDNQNYMINLTSPTAGQRAILEFPAKKHLTNPVRAVYVGKTISQLVFALRRPDGQPLELPGDWYLNLVICLDVTGRNLLSA